MSDDEFWTERVPGMGEAFRESCGEWVKAHLDHEDAKGRWTECARRARHKGTCNSDGNQAYAARVARAGMDTRSMHLVYAYFQPAIGGSILYVGVTSDLIRRHAKHRADGRNFERHFLRDYPGAEPVVLAKFGADRAAAEAYESAMIAEWRPEWNKRG